jgi:hypothetical protein
MRAARRSDGNESDLAVNTRAILAGVVARGTIRRRLARCESDGGAGRGRERAKGGGRWGRVDAARYFEPPWNSPGPHFS